MNKVIALCNRIEGRDIIIKGIQYASLFFASMLESNSKFKSRFYDTYCKLYN